VGQHLENAAIGRIAALLVAAAGFIGALAAMLLPVQSGSTPQTPEIAAVLAVGALALLAGHAWGLLIVALADVMLIGTVWPLVVFLQGSTLEIAAAATALGGALPGLILVTRTLPRTVEVVVGTDHGRLRNVSVAASSVMVALWLTLPVL